MGRWGKKTKQRERDSDKEPETFSQRTSGFYREQSETYFLNFLFSNMYVTAIRNRYQAVTSLGITHLHLYDWALNHDWEHPAEVMSPLSQRNDWFIPLRWDQELEHWNKRTYKIVDKQDKSRDMFQSVIEIMGNDK